MPGINRNALDAFRNFRPDAAAGLKGKALDDAERAKTVDNGVSTIGFFRGDGPGGRLVPYLDADPAPVADPARLDKVIQATPERLGQLRGNPAELKKLLDETIAARKSYLQPTRAELDVPTLYKFNAIVGTRIEQLMREGLALAQEVYGADRAQLDRALYAVNTATFDLYSRELRFDDFEISGYGSFGHDHAFIHAWELRLAELEKVDGALLTPDELRGVEREKKQLQGELDAIFRSKYVYNNSDMYEVNAEVSIGLCLIDKSSRARVSEKPSTAESLVPAFERLSVVQSGETKAVYYDAQEKKYYFDRSAEAVPADLVAAITRQDVALADLTFRRPVQGEPLRKNFRFDWDGDGMVQQSKIDWVSWAGHCDGKAVLETHGVVVPEGHQGVYEYDSRSGSVAHYSRDLLNEKLLSFTELSSSMVNLRTGRRSEVGNEPTQFAGARDDDRPDRLTFGANVRIPWNERPGEFTISRIVTADKTYEAQAAFREHIVAADEKSAAPNPLYAGLAEGDRVQLALRDAAVHATAKFQVFDERSGYTTMRTEAVVLDFKNPADKPIMVDTVLSDPQARKMWEISIDTRNKQWIAQETQLVRKADGSGFEKKNVGDPQRRPIDPQQMVASRETNLDNPAVFMPFVKEALQSARNFTSETADGAGVWNGRTRSLKQATVWRDDASKWAKVAVDVDARYGGNRGSFLVKLKDDGKPDFFVPLAMPFDFAWRTDMAFAPAFGQDVNATARDRGVVTVEGGRVHAEAVTNMMELLHCAFSQRHFVINHNGQRYFFDDRASWEAAKAQLDGLRAAVRDGQGPAPVVDGKLLEVADGTVARGALSQHQLVAEADGEVTVTLDTQRGDADLYVRLGGPATEKDGGYTHRSWKSDLERDQVKIPVKKGDVVGIAVHGYKESGFALQVTGPKLGGGAQPPPPAPAAIDVRAAGVLQRNELKNLEQYPIEVQADGLLRFKMTGSGDADLYVGVNKEPTRSRSDFQLTGANSNEEGTLRVKKGDKVYVKTFGYAARSEFDLSIKSE
jgi:hypothetical protein